MAVPRRFNRLDPGNKTSGPGSSDPGPKPRRVQYGPVRSPGPLSHVPTHNPPGAGTSQAGFGAPPPGRRTRLPHVRGARGRPRRTPVPCHGLPHHTTPPAIRPRSPEYDGGPPRT
ncbi:hypothetical protein GCM10010451_58360 [Streptomyces virens]|uniref:Uncharacterized protein n=1 Tax=Streptomyces virens TaxID=285572 RepID=A0ABP6Q4U6_9ACTN